jgi:hypothetical protein
MNKICPKAEHCGATKCSHRIPHKELRKKVNGRYPCDEVKDYCPACIEIKVDCLKDGEGI